MSTKQDVADWTARALGMALLAQAANAQFRPVAAAKAFGVPTANETNTMFLGLLVGRSIVVGLPLLVLGSMGDRKAMSVVLACAVANALTDVQLCWSQRGNWLQHACVVPVVASLAWILWS